MSNQTPLDDEPNPGSFWKWAGVVCGIFGAYALGLSDGRNSVSPPALYAASDPVEMQAGEALAEFASAPTPVEPVAQLSAEPAVEAEPVLQDDDFAELYAGWKTLENERSADTIAVSAEQPAAAESSPRYADSYAPLDADRSSSYASTAPQAAAVAVPRLGCAENGSCYGDISEATGRPKTVSVRGYYRKDGTYVRGHYRSKPR